MTESALQACLKLMPAPQGQNKGGSLRGGGATERRRAGRGSVDFGGLGRSRVFLFAFFAFFFAFCTSSCVCCRSWSVFVRVGVIRVRFWRGQGRFREAFGGSRALFFEVFECFCMLSHYCGVDAPNPTKHWQEWYKMHIGACRASSARRKKREKHGPAAS